MAANYIKITVRGANQYSFIFTNNFTHDELVQAFPAATALAYSDEGNDKIVIPAFDGIFQNPVGGWCKDGRTYFVIEGKTAESGREQQIKDMMKAIREQKRNTKIQSMHLNADEKDRNALRRNTLQLPDGYTRSRNPKIHIGWQHYKSSSFKQVLKHDGGGVRQLPIAMLDIDAEDIVHMGTDIFFRDGQSKYGLLNDMETSLGDFSGRLIKAFETRNNKKPNLGNYLRDNGFQLSRCTFYLMTRKKEKTSVKSVPDQPDVSVIQQSGTSLPQQPSSTAHIQPGSTVPYQAASSIPISPASSVPQQPGFSLYQKSETFVLLPIDESGTVGKRQEIIIKYFGERTSKYSDKTVMITCHSISQCKDFTSFDKPFEDNEDYNPCENDFSIGGIEIEGKVFLETEFETLDGVLKKSTRFPSSKDNINGIIIHEPLEIWGYDKGNLVVGILVGTTENVMYKWYKDNVLMSSESMHIVVVTDPGVYSCEVSFADLRQLSKSLQIISVTKNVRIVSSSIGEVSTSFDGCCPTTSAAITKAEFSDGSQAFGKGISEEGKMLAMNRPSFAVPDVVVKDLNIDYSSVLGSGTFGTVYKGNWTGSEVAIKAISINKRSQTAMLRMVEKEIEISSKLRHPNIIQFLAVAREKWTIYLVHEYIKGSNMEDAIFNEETKLDMAFNPKDKLVVMKQVVQAVAYMHSLVPVVLHHDIKPANVMIKKGCLTTKLCDMGISRMKSIGAATTTAIGSTCGSPGYMAPECLLRQEKTSPPTDIWSLGITLIEFFTEEDAWSVDNHLDAVSMIMDEMRKNVSPLRDGSDMPTEVMVLLKRCVDYDNTARPSAEEILRDMP